MTPHQSRSRDNNCTLLAHTQVFGGSWNDKKVEIVYRVITWTIKVEISIWKKKPTFLLQNIFLDSTQRKLITNLMTSIEFFFKKYLKSVIKMLQNSFHSKISCLRLFKRFSNTIEFLQTKHVILEFPWTVHTKKVSRKQKDFIRTP